MSDPTYAPPEIWRLDSENGGTFSKTNRPVAGPTHEAALPVGQHPLQLYSMGTPNGVKVGIVLEELLEAGIAEAEYDAWYIDIGAGEQFGSGFVDVNPNSKIPALVDRSVDPPQRVFESGAILMYLAEKFGRFLPAEPAARTATLSWLFWQVGSAPFVGGGFGHFYHYAPTKQRYPIDRYTMETKRQLDVLNRHLAGSRYLAGDAYTIADMAVFPWYGGLVLHDLYGASTFLQVREYQHVVRWAEEIAQRPAVSRGIRVNTTWGPRPLRERHSADDFAGP
jgi:GST-like protein